MIASIIAVASTAASLALWFWTVHRELRAKKDTVRSAWSQLSACRKKHIMAKDGPDEADKLCIYIRSRDIYLQAVTLYNLALQKPWNRIPGFLLGYRQITDGEDYAGFKESAFKQSFTPKLIVELANLAYYDQLTGLPNRTLFKDRLNQALLKAERTGTIFGVLFVDLDSFKRVNDTLGHPGGDQLLKAIAQELNSCVRISDTVARFGGDEFLILVNDLSHPENVLKIADKILARLNRPINIGWKEFLITASIGIAVYPDAGQDAETLIKNADLAMYKAKKMGKNRYVLYSED